MLVVEPDGGCPLDRLGTWLAEELPGADILTCRPWAGDPVPARSGADALLVLGGRMGAHDDDRHPWLPPLRRLLASAVDDAVPTLGICLGAQLLAAATGGAVERGDRGREAGVVDVRWTAAAVGDPLVGGLLDGPYPGPSMHQDAVTVLPPGSVWLGSTTDYPHQVFRVGTAAWGVQFHPEVSIGGFEAWARLDLPEAAAAAAARALAERDDEVVRAGRRLAGRFATLVLP